MTDVRDSGIVARRQRDAKLLGIRDHRPKLVHPERHAELTDALLREKYRPPVAKLDHQRNHGQERRRYDQAQGGEDEIKSSLHLAETHSIENVV
jgi:hypothetical protein